MADILSLIRQSIGQVAETDLNRPMDQLGIDSVDLFDLRVQLDQHTGFEIPDSDWLGFDTLEQMVAYYSALNRQGSAQTRQGVQDGVHFRTYQINMPQMALAGLSENWLMKEMGDFHWNVLCDGLNVDSANIQDELGHRLYATFVRIRWTAASHLRTFRENEYLTMKADMERYGNSMYFSELALSAEEGRSIEAQLMTTFSFRDSDDNRNLKKGQPFGGTNTVRAVPEQPPFGQEYRLLRKGEQREFELMGHRFNADAPVLAEIPYSINPYHDLNGVNLLYFAAYPTINDVCEARYFSQERNTFWASHAFTLARDIFYLNNCDLTDSIRYCLHEAHIENGRAFLHSTLRRESDGETLARIFTVKDIL